MKAWVKRRWIEALRSGDYEQGRGKLAVVDDDGTTAYCCLGVLCQISPIPAETVPSSPVLRWDGSHITPPASVWQWAGLTLDDPRVRIGSESYGLSIVNDDYRMPFSRIADLIEEQLPVEAGHHISPLPCPFCGHVGGCKTKNGKPASRHHSARTLDLLWSSAHTALELGDLTQALRLVRATHEGAAA